MVPAVREAKSTVEEIDAAQLFTGQSIESGPNTRPNAIGQTDHLQNNQCPVLITETINVRTGI